MLQTTIYDYFTLLRSLMLYIFNFFAPRCIVSGILRCVCGLQMVVKESDKSWIFGRYSCRARNRLGEDRVNIDIAEASEFSAQPNFT